MQKELQGDEAKRLVYFALQRLIYTLAVAVELNGTGHAANFFGLALLVWLYSCHVVGG